MNYFRIILCLLAVLLASCQTQQTPAGARTPKYVYHPGETARVLKNGQASIPRKVPRRIQRAIKAANKIVGKPYRSGGGHGRHDDTAYDCSGTVSYVLHEAGMLKRHKHPTSGDFLRWGHKGYGRWLTVYAKRGHVFLMIAGLRLDTTGSGRGVGPRWYYASRPSSGFKVRHVPGL